MSCFPLGQCSQSALHTSQCPLHGLSSYQLAIYPPSQHAWICFLLLPRPAAFHYQPEDPFTKWTASAFSVKAQLLSHFPFLLNSFRHCISRSSICFCFLHNSAKRNILLPYVFSDYSNKVKHKCIFAHFSSTKSMLMSYYSYSFRVIIATMWQLQSCKIDMSKMTSARITKKVRSSQVKARHFFRNRNNFNMATN